MSLLLFFGGICVVWLLFRYKTYFSRPILYCSPHSPPPSSHHLLLYLLLFHLLLLPVLIHLLLLCRLFYLLLLHLLHLLLQLLLLLLLLLQPLKTATTPAEAAPLKQHYNTMAPQSGLLQFTDLSTIYLVALADAFMGSDSLCILDTRH